MNPDRADQVDHKICLFVAIDPDICLASDEMIRRGMMKLQKMK